MTKRITKIFGMSLCLLFILPFASCNNETAENEQVPAGYYKEVDDVMIYEPDDTISGKNFAPNTDVCIYNYAPTIIDDGDTRYMWYCSNKYTAGMRDGSIAIDSEGDEQITDYIAYRKGVKVGNSWYYSPKEYVLSPLKGSSTEGEHLCDPNVIQGEFTYNGKQYPYLMAYLACGRRDLLYNHISLAVAESLEGPWVKCHKINPIKEYKSDDVPRDLINDTATYLWGWGQASMINVDKKGKVLMFYSHIAPYCDPSTGVWTQRTFTTVERMDMSNLNDIRTEFKCDIMPIKGILRNNAQAGVISNGDYAYDAVNNRIYGLFDGSYDAVTKQNSGAPLAYIENRSLSETAEIGDVFRDYRKDENTIWTTVANAVPNDTKLCQGIHNTAIIRDSYGWLTSSDKAEVVFTVSLDPAGSNTTNYSLWTYRLHRKEIII